MHHKLNGTQRRKQSERTKLIHFRNLRIQNGRESLNESENKNNGIFFPITLVFFYANIRRKFFIKNFFLPCTGFSLPLIYLQ